MPHLKTYDLFISHAWKYGDSYKRVVDMLNSASNFKWRNYSVPKHDPKIDPDTEVGFHLLKRELEKQIRPVNCVLIISGMYVSFSKWIQTEIDIANSYLKQKPIVGIIPRGNVKTPIEVHNSANTIVGWNTDSIVQAIRDYSL